MEGDQIKFNLVKFAGKFIYEIEIDEKLSVDGFLTILEKNLILGTFKEFSYAQLNLSRLYA